ncbi:MAG: hypothetical protein HY919_05035 [Elusimicrobia bacterium]|nr:hypothetical protein [Elusimicrobiota bacterium]
MKKTLYTGVVFLFYLIVPAGNICMAAVGVQVTPNSWNAGTGGAGDYATWTTQTPIGGGNFTVKNIGDSPATVKIRTTDTKHWLLSATPGLDLFALQWGKTTQQGTQPQWNSIAKIENIIIDQLASNVEQKFDLRFQSPTDISNKTLTETQFSTITVKVEPSVVVPTNYVFLRKWGTQGSGAGQFQYPMGIVIDTSGNLYVADQTNHRIQKFSLDGTFITQWGGSWVFNYPRGVAVDASGNVYVADTEQNRIQKFNSNGTFITMWGTFGTGDGQFNKPSNIAIDASGNVYVTDTESNRVQVFNSNGTFITKWGSLGAGDGQFNYPY